MTGWAGTLDSRIIPVLQLNLGIIMFEDIRSFLTYLENQGQLLRVKDEVGIKYEIAAVCAKLPISKGRRCYLRTSKGIPAGECWAVYLRRESWSLLASACRGSKCSSAI